MATQEITQKWLAVYRYGKVIDFLTPEDALKKVQDAPSAHKIIFDEKMGKYVFVVCT